MLATIKLVNYKSKWEGTERFVTKVLLSFIHYFHIFPQFVISQILTGSQIAKTSPVHSEDTKYPLVHHYSTGPGSPNGKHSLFIYNIKNTKLHSSVPQNSVRCHGRRHCSFVIKIRTFYL